MGSLKLCLVFVVFVHSFNDAHCARRVNGAGKSNGLPVLDDEETLLDDPPTNVQVPNDSEVKAVLELISSMDFDEAVKSISTLLFNAVSNKNSRFFISASMLAAIAAITSAVSSSALGITQAVQNGKK